MPQSKPFVCVRPSCLLLSLSSSPLLFRLPMRASPIAGQSSARQSRGKTCRCVLCLSDVEKRLWCSNAYDVSGFWQASHSARAPPSPCLKEPEAVFAHLGARQQRLWAASQPCTASHRPSVAYDMRYDPQRRRLPQPTICSSTTPRTMRAGTTQPPHASASFCATAATHRYTIPTLDHARHDDAHPLPHARRSSSHAASVASSHSTTIPRRLSPHRSTPAPDTLSGTTRGTSYMRSTRRSSSRVLASHGHFRRITARTRSTLLVPSSMRRTAVPAPPAHAAAVHDGRPRVLRPLARHDHRLPQRIFSRPTRPPPPSVPPAAPSAAPARAAAVSPPHATFPLAATCTVSGALPPHFPTPWRTALYFASLTPASPAPLDNDHVCAAAHGRSSSPAHPHRPEGHAQHHSTAGGPSTRDPHFPTRMARSVPPRVLGAFSPRLRLRLPALRTTSAVHGAFSSAHHDAAPVAAPHAPLIVSMHAPAFTPRDAHLGTTSIAGRVSAGGPYGRHGPSLPPAPAQIPARGRCFPLGTPSTPGMGACWGRAAHCLFRTRITLLMDTNGRQGWEAGLKTQNLKIIERLGDRPIKPTPKLDLNLVWSFSWDLAASREPVLMSPGPE
ncbi:hypothetical protein C8R44DRAFT_858810 [Mycena epipterygia]|nr:hypothetical protein C8R44DRAFT_858810 [Mycena epipterygia]